MAKKGVSTLTAPMSWEQFQNLSSRIAHDIDHTVKNNKKKVQLSKFLLLINVGSYMGLRLSDILNLSWENILNKNIVEVEEQKTKKTRQITINGNLKSLLNKYVDYIHPATLNEKIFTNTNDSVLSRQYVNRKLKELFKHYKIKVANPSSHTLRKTFSLKCYETQFKSEDGLITLSQILNHSNTAITRKYIGLQGKKIENIYLSL
jgi:integrase